MNKINIKYKEPRTTKQGFLYVSRSLIYTIKCNTLIPEVICNMANSSAAEECFQTRKNKKQKLNNSVFLFTAIIQHDRNFFTQYEWILKLVH